MRIVFLNQKGGVGKSTLVLLLSAVLKRAGYNVALDDRDPQKTATLFADSFGVPLLEDNEEAEYIITDTPGHLRIEGAVERDVSSIIKEADILVLVTEKSLPCIHGSSPMAKLIKEKKQEKAKAYVLFNKVRVQTVIGRQNGQELADKLGMIALQNELPLSSVFENAFVEGLSAVTGQHREEILNLILEIMK